jgi:hypothetical protein
MDTNTIKYLYQHVSPETAYVVDDYPWGFRLRTTIRYWIESKNAKNGGQRFASQTINPKTGQWCKPKYSTYSTIMVMYLDEKEHVHVTSLNTYSKTETINKFKENHLSNLTDFQKKALKNLIAYDKVMQHVTFEIKPSPVGPINLFSKDLAEVAKRAQLLKEQEEREIEQDAIFKKINRAINFEMSRIEL